jgi:hypothetical protein
LTRLDLDAGGPCNLTLVEFSAIANPAHQCLIERAPRLHRFPSGVRDRSDGLGHEQGFLGDGEIDPPPRHLGGQAEMVTLRIKPIERKMESVLPPRRAVA